ncbi:MAG: hypothetical protein ACLTAI_01775 [Thomasclavelia sp.]
MYPIKEQHGKLASAEDAPIVLDKATAKMSIKNKDGKTIMSEVQPLVIGNQTVQSLNTNDDEYFLVVAVHKVVSFHS